jgi:hypothetical protein
VNGAGGFIQQHDIGERAADVNGKAARRLSHVLIYPANTGHLNVDGIAHGVNRTDKYNLANSTLGIKPRSTGDPLDNVPENL